MNAKLTQVSGEDIYIERLDGLNTKVNISIFSKADQNYSRLGPYKYYQKRCNQSALHHRSRRQIKMG